MQHPYKVGSTVKVLSDRWENVYYGKYGQITAVTSDSGFPILVEGEEAPKYFMIDEIELIGDAPKDLNDTEQEKLKEVEKVAHVLNKMHTLKEELRDIFETSRDWSEGLLEIAAWLKDVSKYFPKSFGNIRRWIGEIIAYFDEGTTQGVVEGINNKLKLIKRRAYGFRNFDSFRLKSFLTWEFMS